jgi:hypothetical protein
MKHVLRMIVGTGTFIVVYLTGSGFLIASGLGLILTSIVLFMDKVNRIKQF